MADTPAATKPAATRLTGQVVVAVVDRVVRTVVMVVLAAMADNSCMRYRPVTCMRVCREVKAAAVAVVAMVVVVALVAMELPQ